MDLAVEAPDSEAWAAPLAMATGLGLGFEPTVLLGAWSGYCTCRSASALAVSRVPFLCSYRFEHSSPTFNVLALRNCHYSHVTL